MIYMAARSDFCLRTQSCFETLLRIVWKQADTLSSMSSSTRMDYSQKHSGTDLIEVEGEARQITESSKGNNDANDCIKPNKGEPYKRTKNGCPVTKKKELWKKSGVGKKVWKERVAGTRGYHYVSVQP